LVKCNGKGKMSELPPPWEVPVQKTQAQAAAFPTKTFSSEAPGIGSPPFAFQTSLKDVYHRAETHWDSGTIDADGKASTLPENWGHEEEITKLLEAPGDPKMAMICMALAEEERRRTPRAEKDPHAEVQSLVEALYPDHYATR